jgi:hypothetical protein
MNLGAESIEINLRKPVSGPSALDAMFERLGRKRRSEFVDPAVDKEPRFDFSTTPGGNNDDNFEGGIDFDFDDGGFNDQRLEDENPRLQVNENARVYILLLTPSTG